MTTSRCPLRGPTLSATFQYDGLGRRAVKTINGQTTSFLYDDVDTVRESGATGDAGYLRTLAIDEALTRTDETGTLHYLPDALRGTVALTDGTGNVVTSYSYAPFGDTTFTGLASANPFQFTGRENDGTGLYYYRARYYDPGRGRFSQEDPIRLKGGINFFAYAGNNPIIRSDPKGTLWLEVGIGVGLFYGPMWLFKNCMERCTGITLPRDPNTCPPPPNRQTASCAWACLNLVNLLGFGSFGESLQNTITTIELESGGLNE